ncbi:hypothetical protein BLNAU_17576 [Blattamonas nauphoetae]|uniref:Uncharacterized protein n=1 Tax=Blattamonas nauphoetae TaxID=2049346 RepID=A0ABQ9X721_9EUKA|nr:hypothetical protein BLNAU_17576 [Blattamonas nauphoetae]
MEECNIQLAGGTLVTKLEKFVANSLPDVPQVSLTGHTHLQFTKSSDNRYTMESGSYLKTVGVLDVKLGKKKASFKQESVEFNIQNLSSFCGISESKWETAGGAYIKQTIAAKAEELNLAHIIGYAQTEYSMTPKLTSRSKNVYGLMVDKVLPELGPHTKGQLQSTTNRPVYFLDILLVREKIYKGPVNVFDLYACDPFNYEFYGYANVSGTHLKKVINMLLPPPEDDLDSDPFVPTRIYYYWTDTSIKSDQFYDVYLVATNENDLRKRFEKVAPGKYKIHKTSVFYRDCLAEYIESHWN